jgi:hypothetical protein
VGSGLDLGQPRLHAEHGAVLPDLRNQGVRASEGELGGWEEVTPGVECSSEKRLLLADAEGHGFWGQLHLGNGLSSQR